MQIGPNTRRDEGFSVAEVAIAASILFFVLTAMVGLVGVSQRMTVTAKQRTAVTNATAAYIDRLRAVDYEDIAIEPSGVIKATEEVSYGSYVVKFNNWVSFRDGMGGAKLRTIKVDASTTIGGKTFTHSALVDISNPKDDTHASSLVDPLEPVITFTSQTPAENAVLYSRWVHPSGSSIKIGVDVRSPEDQIEKLEYYVGGVLLRDTQPAQWTFAPPLTTVSKTSGWDTLQDGVRDGLQKVSVYAWDNQGRRKIETRAFIVDNVVPGIPGAPQHENFSDDTSLVGPSRHISARATQNKLRFDAAPDPVPAEGPALSFATRYNYSLYKEPSTLVSSNSSWPLVSSGTVQAGPSIIAATLNKGPITASVPTEAFSRYWMTVKAGSPRDYSPSSAVMPGAFVSRPAVHSSGSEISQCTTNYRKVGSARNTDYSIVLYVSKPTFPVSAKSYEYYVKQTTEGASWQKVIPLSGNKVTEVGDYLKFEYTFRQAGESRALWFAVGVNVTPSGWAGGSQTGFLATNAAGVAAIDSDSGIGSVTATLLPDETWTE